MSLASHSNLGRYRVALRSLATIAALGLPLLSACGRADEVGHSDLLPAPTVAAEPALLAQTLLRPLDSDVDPRMAMSFDRLPPLGGTKPALHADEAAAMSALEQLWRLASAARSDDVGAWLDVNECFLWLGWSPRAERAASVVLAVDAEHPRALALLAAAHTERGRRQRAAQLAEHALESARRRSDAVPVLALVERARSLAAGDAASFFQAVETLREAMHHDPERPEAPFLLGELMLDANHFAGALPLLERASRHEPDPDGGRHATERLAQTFAGLLEGRRPHARPADFAGLDVVLERRPSLPAVEVLLGDGQGATVSGWFIVDSGASMTMLGPEAAHLLRRSAAAQAIVSTATGNHALEPCLLPLLQIGSLRLRDVPALLDAGQPQPIGPGIVGTLGVSLLREFQLVLDLQRGRLQLLPQDGPLRLPTLAVPEVVHAALESAAVVPGLQVEVSCEDVEPRCLLHGLQGFVDGASDDSLIKDLRCILEWAVRQDAEVQIFREPVGLKEALLQARPALERPRPRSREQRVSANAPEKPADHVVLLDDALGEPPLVGPLDDVCSRDHLSDGSHAGIHA